MPTIVDLLYVLVCYLIEKFLVFFFFQNFNFFFFSFPTLNSDDSIGQMLKHMDIATTHTLSLSLLM